MDYLVHAPRGIRLWKSGKGGLKEVPLPADTYTMEDGRAPNNNADWLVLSGHREYIGAMRSDIEGQGAKVKEFRRS